MIDPDTPLPAKVISYARVTLAPATSLARYSLRSRTPDGLPATVLSTAPFGGGTALCLGPDEWLLLLLEGSAAPAIEGAALTNIGHRNVGIVVEGAGAVRLLLSGIALDLERDFAPGKATRTVYEGVEIVLWRTGPERFHLEVWRSFAAYLWDALALAAGDLG